MNILEEKMGIRRELIDLAAQVEKDIQGEFQKLEENAFLNQAKVLHAMQSHGLSEMHFGKTTGYGYDDSGREIIENIYEDIFR